LPCEVEEVEANTRISRLRAEVIDERGGGAGGHRCLLHHPVCCRTGVSYGKPAGL